MTVTSEHRTPVRVFAGLLVAGTMAMGVAAPTASPAPSGAGPLPDISGHGPLKSPTDSGWNGT
jgi:hypothetical protein